MRQERILATISGVVLAGAFGAAALAANPEPVVAEVEFVAPADVTATNPLQFGLVDVNMASGETIDISFGGVLNDPGGNQLNPAQVAAATATVTANGGAPINILVDNVSNGLYYTLSAFQCGYDVGGVNATGACDGAGLSVGGAAAGGSAVLAIGATLTKNVTPAVVGTDNGSFDVTVAYQ